MKYHHNFARHRRDIGVNYEFRVKLTPENDKPMHSIHTQGPLTSIHLRDEIVLKMALLQGRDVVTTLTYSKYSCPIFAVTKQSGKLRLLVDFKRINHLIRHDYIITTFP